MRLKHRWRSATNRRLRRFGERPTAASLTVNLHVEPIMQIDSSPICVCANNRCGVNCRTFRRGNPRPFDGEPVDIFRGTENGPALDFFRQEIRQAFGSLLARRTGAVRITASDVISAAEGSHLPAQP